MLSAEERARAGADEIMEALKAGLTVTYQQDFTPTTPTGKRTAWIDPQGEHEREASIYALGNLQTDGKVNVTKAAEFKFEQSQRYVFSYVVTLTPDWA